jgi:hypothetical protein
MATWTALYINHSDLDKVTLQIKDFTGITDIEKGIYPEDFYSSYLLQSTIPNYLVVGQTQNDWITVRFNSFSKLEDWGVSISNSFSCKVIITMAQSVTDAYYFALYDKGHKLREIEVGQDDSKNIDLGKHFDFEGEKIGKRKEYDNEVYYNFDFECIDDYCEKFGLTIQSDYDNVEWTTLKGEQNQPKISDYVKSLSRQQKKPWWKFW